MWGLAHPPSITDCPGWHHDDIETDELYGLPLERFVPERNALAKALRGDGRREEAAVVARLPRPSVAAWVVNQLVRDHPAALKSLLDAGDALRAAQEAVIDGRGDGHSLRVAAERERAAAETLLGAARSLGGSGGPVLSGTIIDRVADTVHAAAFDEDAREQVRAGRLERELRHVGLGALAAGPLTPAKPAPASRKPNLPADGPKRKSANAAKGGKADAGSARKATQQAEAEAREAAMQAEAQAQANAEKAAKQAEAQAEAKAQKAAKQAEVQARRRADRAARDVTRAEKRQEQAALALQEADAALAAARSEAEAAAEAHDQARERLTST